MPVSVAVFDAIQEVYDDARWLEASRLIEELTDKDDRVPSSPSSGHLTPEQDAKFIKMIGDVAHAVATDNAISTSSRGTRSNGNDDWILATDAAGVCIEYRSEKRSPNHSFAISSLVDFSVLNIVPIMFEADLLPDMMPKFLGMEIAILEERSRFGRLIYQKVSMPPPFRDRYMVLDCTSIDVIEERGGFLILVRSEDPGDRILPPSSKGAVMIDVHLGGTLCRVTGPDATDMITVVNTDAKISGVPTFLINFITRKMMWHAFRAFQKKARVFQADGLPPQYAERRELHSERVYDDIERRFNRGLHIPSPLKIATIEQAKEKKTKKVKKMKKTLDK